MFKRPLSPMLHYVVDLRRDQPRVEEPTYHHKTECPKMRYIQSPLRRQRWSGIGYLAVRREIGETTHIGETSVNR